VSDILTPPQAHMLRLVFKGGANGCFLASNELIAALSQTWANYHGGAALVRTNPVFIVNGVGVLLSEVVAIVVEDVPDLQGQLALAKEQLELQRENTRINREGLDVSKEMLRLSKRRDGDEWKDGYDDN